MGRLTLGHGKRRTPLILQDIQTNTAVGVDVGVVDACVEGDFGCFERVISGEMDRQEEYTAGVWAVIL